VQTTLVGRPVEELDTPALLVDLDAMDRNIGAIAAAMAERGVTWRPHAKGHKSPAIAHRQLAAGAIGITCAKLGEAEVMAAAGIRDILVANQIVGPIKTRRLAALCASGQADVIVAVDSVDNVRELDTAARERTPAASIRVVIEVDTGMERSGVGSIEDAVALAQEVAESPGLRFVGVMGWEGHTLAVADPAERRRAIEAAVTVLTESAAACRDAGLPVEIVSCGGSGTYPTTVGLPGVTEVQAGGATFGDGLYRDLGAAVEPALTLLTQVTSRPTPERVILDAGRKALDPTARPGVPRGVPITGPMRCSAEHGILQLEKPSDTPRVGDRIELDIGYSDQVVHLHEALYAIRSGQIEAIWPVAARGKLQ